MSTTEEQTTLTVPSITIIDATPLKASVGSSTPTSVPANAFNHNTPASVGKGTDPAYRLLYRGALSLPDSYLLLDGLAFSARLLSQRLMPQDSPSCSRSRLNESSSARELMHNPLALALESMRGRQSLRFKGTVRLQDVWMDDTGDVYMDIHPAATLSKIYFENVLCLSPLVASPHDASGLKRTEVGVRVSLGDTDGPETTDIVIYGETCAWLRPPPLQLSSATTSTSAGPPPLSIRVARITPAPRAPRPDDPTPRKPPAHLFGNTTFSDLGANKRIVPRPAAGKDKGKEKEKVEDQVLRRAREVMLHLPRSKAKDKKAKDKDKNVHEQGQPDAVFKVPELPIKACRKQGQGDGGMDVFGTVGPPHPSLANVKGKGRVDGENGEARDVVESANKLMLKKLAAHRLADAGVPRSHHEFKDIFGFVYRGAGFALRSQLKIGHISPQVAEAVVEAHVKMYVLTAGDTHDASGGRDKTCRGP